jgi:hypothetical protein
MALILYFLLAVVGAFALIASWPLITEAYFEAKQEIAEGGWTAASGLAVRIILWLILLIMTTWMVIIGGMFL